MIRFLANRYTREDTVALRGAIDTACNYLAVKGDCHSTTCANCLYHRPCHDLHNLMKRLDEILAIPEGCRND